MKPRAMQNISVRLAAAKDYEIIERLMRQVHALHAGWRPDVYRPLNCFFTDGEFKQLIRTATVLVAEYGSPVCGVLILKERRIDGPVQVPRRILFVDSLAVEEGLRGQGIGSRLMEEALRIAREQDYDGVELQVNAKNTSAKEFYEKLGFTPKSIHMEFPCGKTNETREEKSCHL